MIIDLSDAFEPIVSRSDWGVAHRAPTAPGHPPARLPRKRPPSKGRLVSSARGGPRVRNIHADAASLSSRGESRRRAARLTPCSTPDYHAHRVVVGRTGFDAY